MILFISYEFRYEINMLSPNFSTLSQRNVLKKKEVLVKRFYVSKFKNEYRKDWEIYFFTLWYYYEKYYINIYISIRIDSLIPLFSIKITLLAILIIYNNFKLLYTSSRNYSNTEKFIYFQNLDFNEKKLIISWGKINPQTFFHFLYNSI